MVGSGQPVAGADPVRRRGLPIGLRLLAGFQLVILLAGLVGVLAVQQFSTLTAATTQLNDHDLPEFIALDQLRSLLFQQRRIERGLVAAEDEQRGAELANLASVMADIAAQSDLVALYLPGGGLDGPGRAATAQFVAELSSNAALAGQVQRLLADGQVATARTLLQEQHEPLLARLLDESTRLHDLERAEVAAIAADAHRRSNEASWLVLAAIALFEPLAIIVALLLTRGLTRPLAALLQATRAVAGGDLEARQQVARADEIGQLARAFETMRGNLRATISSLERERRQTQAIIDASADGIVLVDAAGTIRRFNPAAERLSGWSAGEALGRRCGEVFGCAAGALEAVHEQVCPIRRAMLSASGQATLEEQVRLRDGSRPWFAMSCAAVAPDAPGSAQLLAVGVHDISQHKAVEQLKSDFVAMVSHELRAPLTTVSGAVELLGQLDPAADGEAYGEARQILEQQTRRLRGVVEEVLQLTRLEAGHLQPRVRPLALPAYLERLLATVRLEWSGAERPLELCAPPGPLLAWADPSLLELVVRNLLDNARKYTPPASPVTVEALPAAAERVEIRVLDRGPGIPAGQLERIFERFARGSGGADGWTRGYGLGLFIARELVGAQGGTIRAEHRPGGGACFVISLPAATAAADERPEGEVEDEYDDPDD